MPIYLDHAATTPMRGDVIAAYAQALAVVGNPASIHSQGQNAKRMLEEAREQVAASLGADSVEVTFTGGGTESVNLGIKGLFWAREGAGRRILVPEGEHHATMDAVEWLAKHEGALIEWIPIDGSGRIQLDALAAALDRFDDVALVTALLANNEVGTIQPIAEIVALAAAHGVPVHVDAIAAYGYLAVDFHALGAATLSVSAHKIGGPVGVGALLIARRATVVPLVHGGNQQRGRSGTQDVAGAVAFGFAAEQAVAGLAGAAGLAGLRDRLIAGVQAAVPSAILRGDPVDRLAGNVHFTFPGCEGDSLLFLLDVAGFSVSTGSACQAGVPEASHVLLSMGLSEPDARGALRMTLGHASTAEEVDALVAALPAAVASASRAGLAENSRFGG
ncbi:cysteine desulfurase [Glaciihabitans arcticus]|uniref:Cysteine desulfurase n=1 Tax=Glaciihabitans arcticus TaxID=2668039 RepID=A0A4Q9GNI4_9MICO|nr:cysteine desulfurase family protein [Glaciihabitans arcticus]TBN56225.1 cysteine desulfurase [Glaciihabitans arcticus]